MVTAILFASEKEVQLAGQIQSLRSIAEQVLVVDSCSTGRAVEIARTNGAVVSQQRERNRALQSNWIIECALITGH